MPDVLIWHSILYGTISKMYYFSNPAPPNIKLRNLLKTKFQSIVDYNQALHTPKLNEIHLLQFPYYVAERMQQFQQPLPGHSVCSRS